MFKDNLDADIDAAEAIILHDSKTHPSGALTFVEIDYVGA